MLSAPVSLRSPGRGSQLPSGRLVGLPLLAALVVLAGCASTLSGSSSDQVGDGVRAAGQGYWEEAEFRWQKALAIRTGNARALNNLAVRTERAGDFLDAKPFYDRALAAALASMVANLTVGRKGQEEVWEEMIRIAEAAQRDKDAFLRAVDEDTEAFNRVMDAFRIKATTDEEKEGKAQAILAANRGATLVPLSVLERTLSTLQLARRTAEDGNPNSVSSVPWWKQRGIGTGSTPTDIQMRQRPRRSSLAKSL